MNEISREVCIIVARYTIYTYFDYYLWSEKVGELIFFSLVSFDMVPYF